MKRISILGSTGSIGHSTLSVVESYPERFEIVALAAGRNIDAAFEQAQRWKPKLLSVAAEQDAEILRARLKTAGKDEVEVVHGSAGTIEVATHPEADFVVSAIVGVAGLEATYEAVRAGKTVGLANKECLVAAGELITAEARRQGKPLLPIDSEHNAVHQCLRGGRLNEVQQIWLTASGGPFLHTPKSQFSSITVEQALNHPTWKMGRRITIDSATLMNKGFEVIEAYWLFGMPLDRIDVVIHPQSMIHSMVEYVDGSVLAQLGPPDMRLPIQYALTYPERVASAGFSLDWSRIERLEFGAPSASKFPCLGLAREAMRRGGAAPCALNAADETAVAAFLAGRIAFPGIARVVERVLEKTPTAPMGSIDEVLAADREARRVAEVFVAAEGSRRRKN